MKKIVSLEAHAHAPARRALREDSSRGLIHGLLNQLCVINLCTFKLRARGNHSDVNATDEPLRIIEDAITEASELAEALKTIWEKPVRETPTRYGTTLNKMRTGTPRLKIVPAVHPS